jgi:hypothetical protein
MVSNGIGGGRCGRCGYPVRGLPSFDCPECGNDLRVVGIVTAVVRSRPLQGARIVGFTFLFLAGIIPLWMLADGLLGSRWQAHRIDLIPDSRAYEASITTITEGYAWPFSRRRVRLEVRPPDAPAIQLHLRGSALAYEDSGGSGARVTGAKLTADVVAAWIGGSGVSASPQALKDESLDLFEMARAAQRGEMLHRGMLCFSPGGSTINSNGRGPSQAAIAGFFAAAWLIGASYFGRARRDDPLPPLARD